MCCIFFKNKKLNIYLDNSLNCSIIDFSIIFIIEALDSSNNVLEILVMKNSKTFENFITSKKCKSINIYNIINKKTKNLHQTIKNPENKKIITIKKITT